MSRPAAEKTYVIFFTARSGSSWLQSILARTGRLGDPAESFNSGRIEGLASRRGVTTITEYVDVLRRVRNRGGVFGVEVVYPHIVVAFGDAATFLRHFPGASFIWLMREDIVEQAVSLNKKNQTKVGHNRDLDPEVLSEIDTSFVYDPDGIENWVKRIFSVEKKTERLFRHFALDPLRIS